MDDTTNSSGPRLAGCYSEKRRSAAPLHTAALALLLCILGAASVPPRTDGRPPFCARLAADPVQALDEVDATLQRGEHVPERLVALLLRAVRESDSPSHEVARRLVECADKLHEDGQYASAKALAQQAVAEFKRTVGDEHVDTAWARLILAATLCAVGDSAEAHEHVTQAIAILERLCSAQDEDCQALLVDGLNVDGVALRSLARYEEAENQYRAAWSVAVRVHGEKSAQAAVIKSNLASLRMLLAASDDDLLEAKELAQRAYEIDIDVHGPRNGQVGIDLQLLASIAHRRGRFDEAEGRCREALNILEEAYGPDHLRTALARGNLAFFLHTQRRYAEAEPIWRGHLESYERARELVSRDDLGRFGFDSRYDEYGFYAACLARNGKPVLAWNQLERSLARALRDNLGETQTGNSLSASAAEEESAGAERLSLTTIQQQLAPDAAILAWLDVDTRIVKQNEHWGIVLRNSGDPIWVQLPGSPERREWTRPDQDLPERVANLLSEGRITVPIPAPVRVLPDLPPGELKERVEIRGHSLVARKLLSEEDRHELLRLSAAGWVATDRDMWQGAVHDLVNTAQYLQNPDALLESLAAQRIDPLRPHLQGVRRLIVIPAGVMSRVPVEVLTSDYVVSYAPSASVFASLRKNIRPIRDRPSLLAIGDPPYNANHLAQMRTERQCGRSPEVERTVRGTGLSDRQALEAIRAGAAGAEARHALARLVGSRHEVGAVAGQFLTKTVLTGADASEQRVERCLRGDDGNYYDYILISVHGLADTRRPLESALIFSQVDLAPGEDGVLTAREVLHDLRGHLQARVVVLSACESALGPNAGGEWYVGFTPAFLVAGAENVLVSLWPVDDAAAALLIVRFFEDIRNRPLADALHDAKEYVRTVTVADLLRRLADVPEMTRMREEWETGTVTQGAHWRPYEDARHWAGFILVGNGGPLTP